MFNNMKHFFKQDQQISVQENLFSCCGLTDLMQLTTDKSLSMQMVKIVLQLKHFNCTNLTALEERGFYKITNYI